MGVSTFCCRPLTHLTRASLHRWIPGSSMINIPCNMHSLMRGKCSEGRMQYQNMTGWGARGESVKNSADPVNKNVKTPKQSLARWMASASYIFSASGSCVLGSSASYPVYRYWTILHFDALPSPEMSPAAWVGKKYGHGSQEQRRLFVFLNALLAPLLIPTFV